MANSLLICSGKGGVGKTCTAINLGVSLAAMGKDVAVVDANLPTPDIGLHLKIPAEVKTLNDVIRGEASIESATFHYKPHLKIIPAAFSVESLEGFSPEKFNQTIKTIEKSNDITLIDCAPGLGTEVINALKASEKMLIVTNPELPAVANSAKAIQVAQDLGVKVIGAVINRTGRFKHELKQKEINSVMENLRILGTVPEDPLVSSAVSYGKPVVTKYPFSPAAIAFKKVAAEMLGEKYEEKYEEKPSLWQKIKGFFARR